MKKEIRPLCLSFWTPPLIRPQSILIGKMIPEWILQGLNPVTMTFDVCGDWKINSPIYKIPTYKINKYLAKMLPIRLILRYLYFKKLFWQAKKIIKKHKINIVFSFANPQDSNVLGAEIKKKLGIRYISYFSDPWHDNPYKSFSYFAGKKVLAAEKFIVKHSDKVVFTNEVAQKLVMKKYPDSWQEKGMTIPHCYDPKDYTEKKESTSDKFTISYIGAFYKKRNPEMLFKALKKIIDMDKNIKNKIKIKLIGAINDYAMYDENKIRNMLSENSLEDCAEIIPPVSYKDSLRHMKQSDCLVVIDANMPGSPFLPSKTIDYAGSGTIILGITPTNSPTDQCLKGLGYKSFNYDEVDELADYLKKLVNKELSIEVNQEYLKQYDVSATTAKLIGIFKEVLDK
jgi:glycosyltransferase involved in cell wall biosynthesis